MKLNSPYDLPFRVFYQPESILGECNIILRVVLTDAVTMNTKDAIRSTILPFFFLGTSGALAGESIEPWTSTITDWRQPSINGTTIEWQVTLVNIDPQAWVMLAQMLLVDYEKYKIERIEIVGLQSSQALIEVITGEFRFNPYPNSWKGIGFSVDFEELSKNFTVCTIFSRLLSEKEQSLISEELFAWAPGLLLGAYGVAPISPNKCTGFPDESIVFIDNELEWSFSNFKAHTGAIEGLINVFASISKKIVPVEEFWIES